MYFLLLQVNPQFTVQSSSLAWHNAHLDIGPKFAMFPAVGLDQEQGLS